MRGPGGLGKTRFINEFTKILYGEEKARSRLISLNFAGKGLSDIIGASHGDHAGAGVLLSSVTKRTEGVEGKRYINELLFIDEAKGLLTDPNLVEPFKAILENTYGKFESEYLGGLNLHLKDYLIVAAGNVTEEEILDKAFQDRFVMLDFPQPKRELIEKYILTLVCKRLGLELPKGEIPDFSQIEGLSGKNREAIAALLQKESVNFRDVDNRSADILPLMTAPARVEVRRATVVSASGTQAESGF